MNAYLFSDTTKINTNENWKEDESIARTVPEISVQVALEFKSERCDRYSMRIRSNNFKLPVKTTLKARETSSPGCSIVTTVIINCIL